MKIKLLGTAAYEGIPALFCECEVCRKSRALGGRSLRTRTQALIDDRLLLDFPPDTVAHALTYGIDMSKVKNCLITHSHSDHLYPSDMNMLAWGYSHPKEDYCLSVYATEEAGEQVAEIAKNTSKMAFYAIKAFDKWHIDGYDVTALPAVHSAGPVIYQIEDGKHTLLYAQDTHYLHDDIWRCFAEEKPHFDLVILDCTNAMTPLTYVGHMSFAENIAVKKRMCEMGVADDKTVFVSNHFSHNGAFAVYEDFKDIAAKEGFLTSYDGMEICL